MAAAGVRPTAQAPFIVTAPVGPARRRFLNGALIVETTASPLQLLKLCKKIETSLGRRRGRLWGDRPVDIDIILWSGGRWNSRTLTIPHRRWRERDFVLIPVNHIAPDWPAQDGGRVRHAAARHISRKRPVDPAP